MSETLVGILWGGLATMVGSILVWLNTRNKNRFDHQLSQAELDEKRNSGALGLLVTTLQTELTRALERLDEVEKENRECWADREQLHRAMSKLQLRLDKMESK